jgi:serine/threonine-protein phosphatase PP1-1
MPGETNVQRPTTMQNVISSDDIEPPTEITDPKLKRKIRSSDSGIESGTGEDGEDDEDNEDEQRGRPRTAGQSSRGGSAGGDSAIGVNEVGSGEQNFIFLGDFVDRGYFSLETFTLLMCLKAK